jgi:DNA-binding NtrC family response regulator
VSEERTVPHGVTALPFRAVEIHVVHGPDAGRRFAAQSNTISVGTAEDNDLVLTDKTVSRYHLELTHLGERIQVQDHGSTNGTVIGKVSIERGTIAPGAVLTLGATQLRIDDGETVSVDVYNSDQLGPLRGRSAVMRRLMTWVERAAESDASVLVLGETGAGKEVVARAIHELSKRRDMPFEAVDCGALAPTLVASELFGHEKGAFTGAEAQYAGAFERAHRGTLFLDEIGELPQSLQAALLGALERRSFRRVGGTERIEVDVRVISATNRDLRVEVNSGALRQDLYYRIAVLKTVIPPLRERVEDIPLLVEHFLREAGHDGAVEDIVPPKAMQMLASHRWPGNVRELRNFVENALAMGEAPRLEAELGSASVEANDKSYTFPSLPISRLLKLRYKEARTKVVDEFEALYLAELLAAAEGNVSEAARTAKIHRSYLTQMLKRHGIR